jgi:hypothetical protein
MKARIDNQTAHENSSLFNSFSLIVGFGIFGKNYFITNSPWSPSGSSNPPIHQSTMVGDFQEGTSNAFLNGHRHVHETPIMPLKKQD